MRYILYEFIMTSTVSLPRAIQSHAKTELGDITKHTAVSFLSTGLPRRPRKHEKNVQLLAQAWEHSLSDQSCI